MLPGHAPIRPEWLARHTEPPLDPTLPIVDPHHHLFDQPDGRYLATELTADLRQAPGLAATVFVECGQHYRPDGPAAHRPVGETEFVVHHTDELNSGETSPRVAAGIVSHVDLTLGPAVEAALSAHITAGQGRFRGVRHATAWDPDPAVTHPQRQPPSGLYGSPSFRRGFAALDRLGLTFDAWCYHPQIPEVTDLAQAFPDTTIVLDHLGGPLGVGSYAKNPSATFSQWRTNMTALARCPNVHVKLGGLGMKSIGHHFYQASAPPTSQRLANAIRPWVHTAIDLFGADRCMFESNFPMDKASYGYGTFWNACLRLTSGASPTEQSALLATTAATVYKIPIPTLTGP